MICIPTNSDSAVALNVENAKGEKGVEMHALGKVYC